MSWIRIPGVEGLVFEPNSRCGVKRKHNCPDCFYCQMCSDARCQECLRRRAAGRTGCRKRKKK